jgi:cytochrome c oxidase cbb3-type subunit IV
MHRIIFENIENIAIWPIISLSIFFIFFLLLLWWVFTVDKKFIQEMEQLPFNSSSIAEPTLPAEEAAPTSNQTL